MTYQPFSSKPSNQSDVAFANHHFEELYNTKTYTKIQHVNMRDVDNFTASKEISLSPVKTITSSLLPSEVYYTSTFKTKKSLVDSRNGSKTPFLQKSARKTEFTPKFNLSAISFEEEHVSSERKSTVIQFNRTSHISPQRNTAMTKNPHKKRRKIKNPLSHVPLKEYDSEDSVDNFNITIESIENQDMKHESADEKEAPQMGVESAAGNQINYDDIKFVFENQESSAPSEKPVPTIKKERRKASNSKSTNYFRFKPH